MRKQKLAFLTLVVFVISVPATILAQQQMLAPKHPFKEGTAEYLGPLNLTGRDAGLYDLQPSIMYEPDDAARPFKLWWHGQNPGAEPGDAIYFAHSIDGQNWSTPTLVIRPQLATGGDEWADAHLLGACSTIKIGNTYYLFYEGVGAYVTPINRFFNFEAGDTWTTNGNPQHPGYAPVIDFAKDSWERALGVAWMFPKAYSATDLSHPIYAGEVVYSDGKRDRFLSRSPVVAEVDESGAQFSPMYNSDPIFHLFDNIAGDRGRKPIYEFFDPIHRNSYVTDDVGGEGVAGALFNELLGYAASDLSTIDMKHAGQNQIMMATSTDGVNFTRFRGAGPGGSVASPLNPYTNLFNFNATKANGLPTHPFQGAVGSRLHWEIYSLYGSGFPAALVRDGKLELFFTDDSLETPPVPIVPQRMFRIPIDQIENPQEYLDAGPTRQPVYYGTDLKWSPLFQRYFYTNIRVDQANPNKWSPEVQWSDLFGNGSGFIRSTFAETFTTSHSSPRGGGQGGLAGTPLGHTLDFPDAAPPYTAFHLYYAASEPNSAFADCGLEDYHAKDLDRILVFGFHDDFQDDFRIDGVVTINGIEVQDGDTVDFGSVAFGQSRTYTMEFDLRNNANFFWFANTTLSGDFSDNVLAFAAQIGQTHDLTYLASELGAAAGTLTVELSQLNSQLLPYTITLNLVGRAGLLGDVNLDGTVNFGDISSFISVLMTGIYQTEADIDQNGLVNFSDIGPFISILIGQ